jgi:mono/diheme cytochrome c family protein
MKNVFAAAGALVLGGAVLVAQTGAPKSAAPKPQTTTSARPAAAAPAAPRAASGPAPAAAHRVAAPSMAPAEQTKMVAQYCATCHSARGKAGGISLAGYDAARAAEHPEVTEKIIRKLRAGMMPPQGARRPEASQLALLATSLEDRVDQAAAVRPNPGRRPFQRLNRAEYAAAVRDLLDIEVDVTAYLPPDTISAGFDNVADAQTFSPTLMDGYLRAASQISRLAVGDKTASATSVTYKIGRTASQMRQVEGAPIGTRGGISVVHTFPADGDYVFKMNLHNEPLGGLAGRTSMTVLNVKEVVEVSINGERVALLPLNTRMSETDPSNSLDIQTPPIHVQAGPQRVSAAFVQNIEGPIDDLLTPLENTLADVSITFGVTMLPHLRDFSVMGPSNVTGVSETTSRQRLFICRPTSPAEEETCALKIVKNLAGKAYRGAPSAADLQDAMKFYEQGRERGGFEGGVRMALQSVLMSPRFLFRLEPMPTASPLRAYRISDTELASRLSFFIWGTSPDEELLASASAGTLRTTTGFTRQIKRLLADRRARALSDRFAAQWLRLQDLDKIIPDYLTFPQYDATLGAAMGEETRLLFDSIVREDRSVLDLLTADYTFVNERLAKHYNIPNVSGAGFHRVTVPEYRRGLLGQGSILTLTSVADRTSPVQRGKWVMEVLLGSPPPAPPPNVPSLDESVKATAGGKMLSTRERMEEHRKNPSCTSCHRVIDPLGLALDNFDATGAWRIKDNEVAVDAEGELYDGSRVSGPAGLREALLRHQDVFLLSFTEKMMTYALGRRIEAADMPMVRAVVRDARKLNFRMSAFVQAIAGSPAFRMAAPDAPAPTRPATTDAEKAVR